MIRISYCDKFFMYLIFLSDGCNFVVNIKIIKNIEALKNAILEMSAIAKGLSTPVYRKRYTRQIRYRTINFFYIVSQ